MVDAVVHELLVAVSLDSVRAGFSEGIVRAVATSSLGAALFAPFAERLREKAGGEGVGARGRVTESPRRTFVTIGVGIVIILNVVYLLAGIPQVMGVSLAFVAGVTAGAGILILRTQRRNKGEK